MVDPRVQNRRQVAQLGLLLLAFGLLVAPALHVWTEHGSGSAEWSPWVAHGHDHDESQPHSHQRGHRHDSHSVEHLQLTLESPLVSLDPGAQLVPERAWRIGELRPVAALTRLAPQMPQGP
jgi:hypothetical protein